MPLIFGGAVATALGFFAARIDGVERALGLAPADAGLQEVVATQANDLAAQSAEISALRAELADVAAREIPQPEPVDLSGLETALANQAEGVAALASRLEALEKRPVTESVSPEAIAAYEQELERLQSAMADQRAEIESLFAEAMTREDSASDQAELALARAAATRVIAAVENGGPFGAALDDLRGLQNVSVPAVLTENSAGVPALAELQDGFAEAARAALSEARSAEAGEGGVAGFLARQLNARSVTPREGDSADAVLSRAEAALRQSRLGDALAELETLSDPVRAVMSDWIALAQTRHDAVQAANTLLADLATN